MSKHQGRRAAEPSPENPGAGQSSTDEAPAERTYSGRRSNGESEAEQTGTYRAIGGRRAAEPVTGTIPVITAPLLGDEPGGRRIRPAAPVSSAPELPDRRVTRSFDHTGEIPAVQFTLPPRETSIFQPLVPEAAPADSVIIEPSTAPVEEAPSVEAPAPDAEESSEPAPAGRGARSRGTWESLSQRRAARAAARAEARDEAQGTPDSAPEPDVDEAYEESFEQTSATGEIPALPSVVLPSFDEIDVPDASVVPETPGVTAPVPEADATPEPVTDSAVQTRRGIKNHVIVWGTVLAAGVLLLALAALHVGPAWFDGIGATAVLSAFCWAAAARTGGRKAIFTALGFGVGLAALLVDGSVFRSGAAVMTCVVSGVLAVVFTVPARTVLGAVREVAIATAVASVGAFATVGFEPVASTSRFEILTLIIGMVAMVVLVWRFAAGLHGLGTRGLVIVAAGAVLLGLSQLYTELLRNYGASGVVQPGSDFVLWMRDTIGAAPRMIMVFLGVPALLYGVHMRARRRQGWWVCTFGAAATLPVAQRLVNLDTSYVEAGLQTFYSVALGCLVGFAVIRLDQRFTGTRGARARALEQDAALRPEPRRFSSL